MLGGGSETAVEKLQYCNTVLLLLLLLFCIVDSADVECPTEAKNSRRGHTAGVGSQIQTEGCGGTNRSVSVCDIEHSLLGGLFNI